MYKIYDDIVDVENLKQICSHITENTFSWFLSKAVKYDETKLKEDYDVEKYNIEQYAMFHLLIDNNTSNSKYHPLAVDLIQNICEKAGITHEGILRAQFNLVFQHPKSNLRSCPHIDNRFHNHGVILLYINDSDGDTYIYKDGTREVDVSISPKQGRVVIFDGTHVHSAGTPVTNDTRLVMNVNLFNMKWNNDEKPQPNKT
jgi:hypothetical protein